MGYSGSLTRKYSPVFEISSTEGWAQLTDLHVSLFSCISGRFFTIRATMEVLLKIYKVTFLCIEFNYAV